MITKWLSALSVGSLAMFCALAVVAQTEKTPTLGQYIISAKAGGVNFVEGKVTVMRRSGTSGLVIEGDEIQVGDRVSTGEDGLAEVLLNPGSFLRLGHDTSFEFGSTDLENLKINLKVGSAIFEVYATDDFKVSIRLPQSEMQLTRSGVFRVDVMSDGSAKLTVLKGKTYVGPGSSTEVNAGRVAAVTKSGVSVSKFDKSATDALDVWSKSRSKELVALNDKLQRDSLRNSLLSSFNNNSWNLYNSFGLWLMGPGSRRWLFLPFGFGWSSPYGWDYGWNLWRCNMPWYIYNPTYYPSVPVGTGGGPPPNTAAINEARRERMHTPPFQRAEQSTKTESNNVGIRNSYPSETRGGETRGGGDIRSTGEPKSSSPVYTPPIVAPAPAPVEVRNGTKGRPGD